MAELERTRWDAIAVAEQTNPKLLVAGSAGELGAYVDSLASSLAAARGGEHTSDLTRRLSTHLNVLVSAAAELDVTYAGVGIRRYAASDELTRAINHAVERLIPGARRTPQDTIVETLRLVNLLDELADRWVSDTD